MKQILFVPASQPIDSILNVFAAMQQRLPHINVLRMQGLDGWVNDNRMPSNAAFLRPTLCKTNVALMTSRVPLIDQNSAFSLICERKGPLYLAYEQVC